MPPRKNMNFEIAIKTNTILSFDRYKRHLKLRTKNSKTNRIKTQQNSYRQTKIKSKNTATITKKTSIRHRENAHLSRVRGRNFTIFHRPNATFHNNFKNTNIQRTSLALVAAQTFSGPA